MQIERQKLFRYVNDVGMRPQTRIIRIFLTILQNRSEAAYPFSIFCGSPPFLSLSSPAVDAGNA